MAHILVVDDDPAIQNLIKDVLSSKDHTIKLASNGGEALQKIRATRFDLVILDLRMPDMDGLQVLNLLRSNPSSANLKVLMCTAAGMMADVDKAFQAGASDYIVKPLDFVKLNAKVTQLTRKA